MSFVIRCPHCQKWNLWEEDIDTKLVESPAQIRSILNELTIASNNKEQDFLVLQYSVIMSAILAEQYRESFKWSISLLNENNI